MVPAVVLAAGQSTRMGMPKALLPIGDTGETFLTRIVDTMQRAGVEDVVVVVGPDSVAVENLANRISGPLRLIRNPEPERGQLTSLLAALDVIDRPGVRAVLVTLVDLPLVTVETVRLVLEVYRRTGAPLVRPVKQGRHGHPVVFDRTLFDELRHADLLEGARSVVRAHESTSECVPVEVEDEGAFTDIDTPEDYARLVGQWPPRS